MWHLKPNNASWEKFAVNTLNSAWAFIVVVVIRTLFLASLGK